MTLIRGCACARMIIYMSVHLHVCMSMYAHVVWPNKEYKHAGTGTRVQPRTCVQVPFRSQIQIGSNHVDTYTYHVWACAHSSKYLKTSTIYVFIFIR